MVMKSAKLAREEAQKSNINVCGVDIAESQCKTANKPCCGSIEIKVVECLNDFVAIWQTPIETTIAVPDQYKQEGIVVGVGPGLPNGASGRCPSQLQIGDVVLFSAKATAGEIESESGFYKGKKIIILSERNMLCKIGHKDYQEFKE